jgi:hypothetical protein
MMKLRCSRAFAGGAVLLLMFSLGLVLVTLLRREHQRQTVVMAPAQQPAPNNPSEVVEAYWTLSQKGEIEAANRYCAVYTESREGLVHGGVDPSSRPSVADLIWQRKWKLAGIEQEVADEDGSVLVQVRVTSYRSAYVPTMKHILRKVQGEWKIVETY